LPPFAFRLPLLPEELLVDAAVEAEAAAAAAAAPPPAATDAAPPKAGAGAGGGATATDAAATAAEAAASKEGAHVQPRAVAQPAQQLAYPLATSAGSSPQVAHRIETSVPPRAAPHMVHRRSPASFAKVQTPQLQPLDGPESSSLSSADRSIVVVAAAILG
jgi:hypothetical protein